MAVRLTDHEFDTALIQLGILPPLDLSIIRSWLTIDDVELRATENEYGHRIIDVMIDCRTVARIQNDGHVVVLTDQPVALLSA